ncbi:hypothetical protein ILUMI_14447 [Ignelater luminosus]|uniref:Uncharacterized protein n=1 Tax=Ignelater luminosus TaxID=2038154 RepID=A0A8K0CU78_IGNLU|nr:hypothetical protein ILUMI_14447 [Ignelater luminosus]
MSYVRCGTYCCEEPESLRQLVLKLGHEGHPGMVKMKGTQVGTMMTYQLPKQVRRTTTKMSQVEHDSIRRESSVEPKEEGNEEERSLLSARSPARLRSHPSRTRQPPNWLLDYDKN